MAASEHANRNERDSPSSGPGEAAHTPNPKRWYERTSMTLCVAAGLAVVGSGFLHVILGVVVEIRPEFAEGRIRRGRLYVAMNEPDKASAEFTKAAAIDPKSAEAIFHRSLVYFVRGDYEKALEAAMKIEGLGQAVPTEFLRALRGDSDQDGMEISTSLEE
mgnify:CR=1 FL=1